MDAPVRDDIEKKYGVHRYIAGIAIPIVFLTSQPFKSNSFLRFHSVQSIFFVLILIAERVIVDFAPRFRSGGGWFEIGWILTWIFLMIKARRGAKFKLPLIGNLAERGSDPPTNTAS